MTSFNGVFRRKRELLSIGRAGVVNFTGKFKSNRFFAQVNLCWNIGNDFYSIFLMFSQGVPKSNDDPVAVIPWSQL